MFVNGNKYGEAFNETPAAEMPQGQAEQAQEPLTQSTDDASQTGKSCKHGVRRFEKHRRNAERAKVYQEFLSATAAQNTAFLEACAEQAVKISSSVDLPVKSILEIYASGAGRSTKAYRKPK